jgi:hypothetical protein
MPDRLKLEDPSEFPVQAFFNAVSDNSFVDAVDCLTKGIGYSMNDAHCTFPTDLDADEKPFHGVRFSLFEQSATITREQLRCFVKLACDKYVEKHPQHKDRLAGFLVRRPSDNCLT